jgi:ketosteroid isomerase-like protein
MTFTGAHAVIYSKDPDADRAFLRDRLGLEHIDIGHGWLIFRLPPAEVAVHPSEENDVHELFLMCDDVGALIERMAALGVAASPVQELRWGRLTKLTLPGGGALPVYEPRHPSPPPAAGPAGGNLERAKAYLAAVEAGATGDELARFYADDVVQEEFPNRLLPNGARRDLAALLDGAARGQQVMRRQRFEVVRAFEAGDAVVLEVSWTGTLAAPVGALAAGGEMRARFAVVLEFRDGRIAAQRNYDCFDPF